MSVDTIGLILVPVCLFIIGAIVTGVRGAIRFAQYMVRSEEAQTRTADGMDELRATFGEFKSKTEAQIAEHDRQLAVVQWEIENHHGRSRAPRPASESY